MDDSIPIDAARSPVSSVFELEATVVELFVRGTTLWVSVREVFRSDR